MIPHIEIEGLEEILARMKNHRAKLMRVLRIVMDAALHVLWENVPGYPPQPMDTEYQRTGTLGRTLGVGESGGTTGEPDIFVVRDEGGLSVAEFGTRLEYASYVIGDYTEEQASHMRHWWTLPQDVVHRSFDKIVKLFETMAQDIADWLVSKGE